MGDIYASATRIVVWLGEKSAKSDMAMDYIRSFRQRTDQQLYIPDDDDDNGEGSSNKNSSSSIGNDKDDSDIDGNKIYDDDDDGNGQYFLERNRDNTDMFPSRAVRDLMGRKWWTRIWVVQEVLKSRRVTVVCGDKEVDMGYFVQLVKETFKLSLYSSPTFVGILSNWYSYKQRADTSGLSLMDLILETNSFQASIQRDRIYALLGLTTSEARSWILPDYSNAMSHRFFLIRVTIYFLQISWRPLRFASYCRAIDCPSWVSDWTAIDSKVLKVMEDEISMFKNDAHYDRLPSPKNKGAKFSPQFEPPLQRLTKYQEPYVLIVHGVVVDRVSIVVQIPTIDSENGVPFIKAKIREWKSRMSECTELYHSEMAMAYSKFHMLQRRIKKDEPSNELGPRDLEAFHSRDLEASVIMYLDYHMLTDSKTFHRLNFYGQLLRLRKDFRETWGDTEVEVRALALINEYETWMEKLGQCENFHEKDSSSCASCSGPGMSRPRRLGRAIMTRNKGRTLFLTDNGFHYAGRFAVNEGDVICKLWDGLCIIIRRTEDEHWTLVGHCPPDEFPLTRFFERDLDARTEMFRLK